MFMGMTFRELKESHFHIRVIETNHVDKVDNSAGPGVRCDQENINSMNWVGLPQKRAFSLNTVPQDRLTSDASVLLRVYVKAASTLIFRHTSQVTGHSIPLEHKR